MVVILAYLSIAAVQKDRKHITVDILPEKLRARKAGPILDCILLAVSASMMAFMLVEVIWFLVQAYKMNSTTTTLFGPFGICFGHGDRNTYDDNALGHAVEERLFKGSHGQIPLIEKKGDHMITGSIGILGLLLSVCIGLPVGIALLFVATVGLLCLSGLEQTFSLSAPMFYNFIGRYEFSVIPMFVLMGNIGFHSGLFTQIFETARKWAGRLPAGLAVAVVIGQTISELARGRMWRLCGDWEVRHSHHAEDEISDDLATGVVAGSGTLAVLIPPSVTICIYGILVNESIGKLLIAGILPGLLSAAIFITLIMIQSRSVPRDPTRYSLREKMAGMSQLWVIAY